MSPRGFYTLWWRECMWGMALLHGDLHFLTILGRVQQRRPAGRRSIAGANGGLKGFFDLYIAHNHGGIFMVFTPQNFASDFYNPSSRCQASAVQTSPGFLPAASALPCRRGVVVDGFPTRRSR